jgi:predicted permease
VYGVLLKPLPFDEPDRLVALEDLAPGFGVPGPVFLGHASYFTYRDNSRVFEDIGLWQVTRVSLLRNNMPEQVQALNVTDGLLPLLRVRPALGRLIQQGDDVPSAPRRVLLTYGCWQRTFGDARDVLGRLLVIDGNPYEIIGVLPQTFNFLDKNPEVVLPMRLDRATAVVGDFGLPGLARLKPHVTLEQANADVARMIPLIPERFPLSPGLTRKIWDSVGLTPNVRPLAETVIGTMGRPLWILLGAVSFVLLIAWSNVGNLLLVRAEGRRRELAVRGALGASRARLATELLSETLILGLAGGALGVQFAQAGLVLLRRIAPTALPRVDAIGIDPVVLVITLATAVITSLFFGLIPALRLRKLNVELLKETGRSTTESGSRQRTRNGLVVVQIAIALVLLIVSGLMVRTFVALRHVEPGFVRPAEVQTFAIALPAALISDPQQVLRTHDQIAERLRHVPGVTSVGLASSIGTDPSGGAPISVEDKPLSETPPMRKIILVGPGYFETMGNPFVAGRGFTSADLHQPSSHIAMVSESFAREYWGEPGKALGKRIGCPSGPWCEVVGVVGNELRDGVNRPPPGLIYWPSRTTRNMTYVVRSTRVGTPGFLRELQQAVWSVSPNVPLGNVRTLDDILARSIAPTSFAMVMLAIAASVALLLALVGLYGVVSYAATERTHEVGIRMALGARPGDVLTLFLRHGLALSLAGVMFGTVAAVFVTPIISALLYGVRPTDPATYIGVATALATVTFVAMYLPARRASHVDPVIALHSQL